VNWLVGVLILVFGGLLVWLGGRRVTLPRRASFEEIDDPAVGQAYDRISRWPQFHFLRAMIIRKLTYYSPAGTLADIGCGPGYLVVRIAQRFSHLQVIGVDNSGEMIEIARVNAERIQLSGQVSYRFGDVIHLPFGDGELDFAVSTASLHHWSEPGKGLAEISRVLKPGGQLLLFDLRRDPPGIFLGILRFAMAMVVPRALRQAGEPLGSVQASYTPTEVEALLAASPFKRSTVQGGFAWYFAWAKKE